MAANEKQNLIASSGQSRTAKPDWTERLKLVNKQLAQAFLMMQKPVPDYEVLTAMSSDLLAQGFSDDQIAVAITRVTRECEWLTPKAIIERIPGGGKDDGRPEVESAWAMCPKSEELSVVWTSEMGEAFAIARALLNDGDQIGARMAFKEQYQALVDRARAEGKPPRWLVSLGYDKADRVRALSEAVQKNRIEAEAAMRLLGPIEQDQLLMQLPAAERKTLTGEAAQQISGMGQILQSLRESKTMPKELNPAPVKAERKETTPEEWADKKRNAKQQFENYVKQQAAKREQA